MSNNKIVKNAAALYIMNIAKMILPLITLPYLTRVLSKDCYGIVSYVKATMQYMQLIIDFGFILSGTKDIVKARDNKELLSTEIGNIFGAKVLLGIISGFILLVLTIFIPILRENFLFTLLSFLAVFLTCFLFDYLFRGLEEMQVITIRFVVMKLISTALTFVFVSSDKDLLFIPILDIIGTIVAIGLVLFDLKKRRLSMKITSFTAVIAKIKESAIYFASDIATTAFGALNTLLIGIYITEAEVADWSLCMQLVVAVQSMYSPLANSIYPEMVKSRNFGIVKKTLKIFLPIIAAGCIFTLFIAKYALLIVGGEQYIGATLLLRCLVPVMFFGFLSMLFGWPTLGSIGKTKETTKTTVVTAVVQIVGLVILLFTNQFNLINIALLRGGTEMLLFVSRYSYYRKFKNEFSIINS